MKMPFSLASAEIVIVAIGVIVGGVSVTSSTMMHSAELQSARTEFTRATDLASSATVKGRKHLASATETIAAARKLLASSAGRTDDESARTALSSRIIAADRLVTTAKSELREIGPTGTKRMLRVASIGALTARTRLIHSLDLSALNSITPAVAEVAAAEGMVTTAVTSWTTDQARAAAAIPTENVWTSGFQTQLNACRGAVDLTAAYGVPTIGEKWNCGGSRFPQAGSLVRLTGVLSGVFRVGGVAAILNAYTDSPRDIPRGYQVLYQTCRGNDPRVETFTVLTRVS